MNDILTGFSIPEFLYEENSLGVFVLVTLILGGGAAALAGRAIAATWRPWWQVVVYGFILAAAVRFIHFSLYGGTFLSVHYYLVDSAFCELRTRHHRSRLRGCTGNTRGGSRCARVHRRVAAALSRNEPRGGDRKSVV